MLSGKAWGVLLCRDLLYRMFGINAELLIDHAWGWEPCTIADIKAYRPEEKSVGAGLRYSSMPTISRRRGTWSGRWLTLWPWSWWKNVWSQNQVVLTVSATHRENLTDPGRRKAYRGEITVDRYGRQIPRAAHGTDHLRRPTSSSDQIVEGFRVLFDQDPWTRPF